MSKESALATVTAPASLPPEAIQNPEVPQPDAARFAALARKEAQIVRDRETFKKEQETFASEREKVRAIAKRAQDFETLRQTDAIAALKSIGFNETEIFNYMAAQEPKPELTIEERAKQAAEAAAEAKFKAWQEAEAKKLETQQGQRDKQIVEGFRAEMSKFIETNQEKFEYCAFHGKAAEDLAYEIVVQGLRDSNGEDLIDFKEAIQMTEDFYEEQDQAMSTLKKRQPKDQPAAAPAAPQRTRTVTSGDPNYKPVPPITRTRTLSNDSRPTAASSAPRAETREQKRERLISLIAANGLRK